MVFYMDPTRFGSDVGLDLCSLFLALTIPLVKCIFTKCRPGLPPFPVTPIPILGNLLTLEKDPRAQFSQWRKIHGDVFSIYLGQNLTVVLNGYDIMREALVTNADMFSDRPDIALFTLMLRGRGIVATSGHCWRTQRRFALAALKQFGFGRQTMERDILEEIKHVLEFFASKHGMKHEFSDIYNISTSNLICLTMFGHRFRFYDKNFIACCSALHTAVEHFSNMSVFNFFPFLLKIPGFLGSDNIVLENFAYFEEHLIKAELKRHYNEYDGATPDFVAAYIQEIKDRESAGLDVSELKDNFTQTITDLFVGGSETTATTLKWLVLFLIRYPEVQERCFMEINENVGLERFPSLKDKSVLPYVEATVAETQRIANIGPFGVLHATSEDTSLRGYNIPKGTIVMLNMDSVLMDPETWPEPEEFRPERFLDKSGAFFKPESFIPFSTGRRVCMGEALAKMELFLFTASLIQNVQFLQPDDEPPPSLKARISAASVPQPYKVRAVQRSSCASFVM